MYTNCFCLLNKCDRQISKNIPLTLLLFLLLLFVCLFVCLIRIVLIHSMQERINTDYYLDCINSVDNLSNHLVY